METAVLSPQNQLSRSKSEPDVYVNNKTELKKANGSDINQRIHGNECFGKRVLWYEPRCVKRLN